MLPDFFTESSQICKKSGILRAVLHSLHSQPDTGVHGQKPKAGYGLCKMDGSIRTDPIQNGEHRTSSFINAAVDQTAGPVKVVIQRIRKITDPLCAFELLIDIQKVFASDGMLIKGMLFHILCPVELSPYIP